MSHGALRVPEITVYFWVDQGAVDRAGRVGVGLPGPRDGPVAAVGLGFIGFLVALGAAVLDGPVFAWTYWFAVVMVGVFGTMAADVLHVGFGVPYAVSSMLYAVALAVVFIVWWRTERTLSIHTIDTARREAFYWAAVVATFAMGTAVGDLTAVTFHLGYAYSMVVFIGVIACPSGYWRLRWNPIWHSGSPTCSPAPSAHPSPTGSASRAAPAGSAGATDG